MHPRPDSKQVRFCATTNLVPIEIMPTRRPLASSAGFGAIEASNPIVVNTLEMDKRVRRVWLKVRPQHDGKLLSHLAAHGIELSAS